jgi:O-acetyl-ADP-ribose deacetylase
MRIQLHSVAFPAISTGAFGYPIEEAAGVAAEAVVGQIPRLSGVKHIRFVFASERDMRTYAEALEAAVGKPGGRG